MNIEQFRSAGYAAIDSICDYYETLQSRPVKAEVQPGYLIESLPSAAPLEGEEFSAISSDFNKLILSGITHWQHGQFFAYFPANSTFESMLGELYAASVSNPGFNWICSPACTELEQVVLDWMAQILGLDERFTTRSKIGGGIIMGSASESCLTAAMAARERALRHLAKSQNVSVEIRERYGQKLVMYGSTQTHSLGAKAALLLGLQFKALPVSSSDAYALRGSTLKRAIEEDVANGLIPFFVIATVGTTSTGAVDYIEEIGQILKSYPTAFLHIDAAWAGVAYALPSRREALRLSELNIYADSFCTNMHKWGLVGFDCSLFFIRDRTDLTEAFDVTPAFLRSTEGDAGTVIDYRNWQIALGRRFRSVKLWFVLRSYGVTGLQSHLINSIDQCTQLAARIRSSEDFELVTEPSLALLVFRLTRAGLSDQELNVLNQQLNTRLTTRSDVFLTQTMLHSIEGDIFCIRFALGGVKTTMEDVLATWKVVEEEARVVLEGRSLDP